MRDGNTLQWFWTPTEQLCQSVFPQKPHHTALHNTSALLRYLRPTAGEHMTLSFRYCSLFLTAMRTNENRLTECVCSITHPSKNCVKLLQKMCSFSCLKHTGKDRERIIISSHLEGTQQQSAHSHCCCIHNKQEKCSSHLLYPSSLLQ